MIKSVNMEALLDNILFDKPIKAESKPIKETVIDVNKILKEADPLPGETLDDYNPETDQNVQPEQPSNTSSETLDNYNPEGEATTTEEPQVKPIPDEVQKGSVDELVKQARKISKEHEPNGDLVLEVALQLEGKECGKLQIGSEEYDTITNWKIIMDKFGIKFKTIPESIKSFRIDAETKYSQTESDSVGIAVEMADDGETLGIQVFYNEDGTVMDNLEQALNEFNRRYREYIISAINEKIRS